MILHTTIRKCAAFSFKETEIYRENSRSTPDTDKSENRVRINL